MKTALSEVEKFWDKNPLFTGEENFNPKEANSFFLKHDEVYFNDVFSGINYKNTFSLPKANDITLDLGCGIGFWSSLLKSEFGIKNLISGDLSQSSLDICKIRVPETKIVKLNAEQIELDSSSVDFVNCQGVIHHTPNTEDCVKEIYRVLKKGGRASISVYYENFLIKVAAKYLPLINWFSKILLRDMGRDRAFHNAKSKDDLIRLYDGKDNPIGKCYSKAEFFNMVKNAGFEEIEIKYFFFPFRFFYFPLPKFIRPIVVKILPFMMVANLKKQYS